MFKKLTLSKALVVLAVIASTQFEVVEAQIDPGNAGKTGGDLIAIKTDPVLRNPTDLVGIKTDPVLRDPKEMIGIKTDPVLSNPKDMISIKTDPVPRGIDTLNLNAGALVELLAALEKSGVKVVYKLVELDGVTILDVSLNGNSIAPFIVECKGCEPIVYEY